MRTKFHSLVWQAVYVPMAVMLLIVGLTIAASLSGYQSMRQKVADGYLTTIRIAHNRAEVLLDQIDERFLEYWSYDESYAYLRTCTAQTPPEQYLLARANTITWMQKLVRSYSEAEGAFVYYRDLDMLLFRGSTNFAMHEYLRDYLQGETQQNNVWRLISVENQDYLINVQQYHHFYGGMWIPLRSLRETLGLTVQNYPGEIYVMDRDGRNSIADDNWNSRVRESLGAVEQLENESGIYRNSLVMDEGDHLGLGLLLSEQGLLGDIPLFNKAVFFLAFWSILLVPLLALWLRRKIAKPVQAIYAGMQRIGAGEMDYRIPLEDKPYRNELDGLIVRFNQMSGEIKDMGDRLFRSKIHQQRTELKYISQQIRPHFILNALNLIYTYEEDEFPLVKKMVLYLSEYFRYVVNLQVDFVPLEQEMRHIENYLRIQKERYLERFEFVVQWEAQTGEIPVPPLLLQTFVENSMKYGMAPSGVTLISVIAQREGERLKLTIADTGSGFPAEALARLETFLRTRQSQPGLGVGLQNAVERMDILYGRQVEVIFRNRPTGGAMVELILPTAPPTKGGEIHV